MSPVLPLPAAEVAMMLHSLSFEIKEYKTIYLFFGTVEVARSHDVKTIMDLKYLKSQIAKRVEKSTKIKVCELPPFPRGGRFHHQAEIK